MFSKQNLTHFKFLRSRWVTLGIFFLFATLGLPINASPLESIIGGDVPPYSWMDGGHASGPALDIVQELSKRMGNGAEHIELYPWARTVLLGEHLHNTLIFPLSRTSPRESKFTWIVELMHDHYVLISKATSTANISSLGATRSLRIGCLRGSPGEQLVAEANNVRADAADSEENNARKLAVGRIDVWLANRMLADHAWEKIGGKASELRYGPTLLDLHMYLAADKYFSAEEAEKWRRAFGEMRRDGTLLKILAKYGLHDDVQIKHSENN